MVNISLVLIVEMVVTKFEHCCFYLEEGGFYLETFTVYLPDCLSQQLSDIILSSVTLLPISYLFMIKQGSSGTMVKPFQHSIPKIDLELNVQRNTLAL